MVVHLSHDEIPSCIRHITQFHPALHHEIPSCIRYTKFHHGGPSFTSWNSILHYIYQIPSWWSVYHITHFHPALDGYMDGLIYHIMKFHPALDAYMDGSIYHIMKFHPTLDIPNSIMVVHLSHHEIPSCIRWIYGWIQLSHHEIFHPALDKGKFSPPIEWPVPGGCRLHGSFLHLSPVSAGPTLSIGSRGVEN